MTRAIICDLDGTLASVEHRRRFVMPVEGRRKQWHEFHRRLSLDAPVPEVLGILRALQDDVSIVLTSGRPDAYRYQTEWWLMEHEVPYDELFMRRQGDSRLDSIVKREIYERDIAPKYQVVYAIDDRPQVVDVWRSLGIPVLVVVDPGLEPLYHEVEAIKG